ncbi:MAG: hypothetical protein NWF07_01225 [Candidatus Bathyarchaeota archaeon]|nr:hypothetical protein [Candidatus Bathyarchaeota archaeon]
MFTRTVPYNQSIIVRQGTVEEVYDTINVWLRFNGLSVTKENPPTDLEAYYNAEVLQYSTGPTDSLPKNIQIRISGFDENIHVNITITQTLHGKKTKGYIYWGTKLLELYKELGVEVTNSIWIELFPPDILGQKVSLRVRQLGIYFIFSCVVIWFLWSVTLDAVMMYVLVIMIPVMLLIYWDMQGYRQLLKPPP